VSRSISQLKPVCVELLAGSLLSPQGVPRVIRSLSTVYEVLATLPSDSEAAAPSLLSYVFFPVSQILQRNPPAALSAELRLAILRVLCALVEHWQGGEAVQVREQVWRLAIGWWKSRESLGGTEEAERVWVQVVHTCAALPDSDLDDGRRQLCAGMRALLDQDTFLPVLGETFSVLIGARSKRDLTRRRSEADRLHPRHGPGLAATGSDAARPLGLLSTLLKTYFGSAALSPRRQRILATILPGATSALCKVVSPTSSDRGGKGVRSEVVILALGIIRDLLVSLFPASSNASRSGQDAASGGISDLSDLQDWIFDDDGPEHRSAAPPSPTPSTSSLASMASMASSAETSLTTPSLSTPAPQAHLVVLTPSWSTFTLRQLHPALASLAHLRQHQHPLARRALADLSGTLLARNPWAFEESWLILTGNLLVLAGDDYPAVSSRARAALEACLGQATIRVLLLPVFRQLVMDSLFTLPFLLRSPAQTANDKILASCRLVSAAASISELGSLVQGILGPLGGVEKWADSLLGCLDFATIGASETANFNTGRRAELAWTPSSHSDATLPTDCLPRFLCLSNVSDPATERAFADMLSALGAAAGEEALFAVEHFVTLSSPGKGRGRMSSVAGLWCAETVLKGITAAGTIASATDKGKGKASPLVGAPGKRTRRAVRSIVRLLVEQDENEAEGPGDHPGTSSERPEGLQVGAQNLADTLLPTEYVKGLSPLSTLLDRPTSRSGTTSSRPAPTPEVVRSLRTIQVLSLLVRSASILSTGFRPLLLHALYHLLSHLSSPVPAVSSAASSALAQIAFQTGYASAQNLVLDNSDYVINVVSQRLTSQRLDQAAPAVLISMIQLVGAEIVPLVHDIVDEIFDALDAFHGYEVLASTLLAVLDALLQVMAEEAAAAAPGSNPHRTAHRIKTERPDPARDAAQLSDWFLRRHDRAKDDIEEIRLRPPAPVEPAPQEPWGADPNQEAPSAPVEAGTSLPDADGPAAPKPTRSQEICSQILAKALFFLTHASPFLRARVLSLFRSAILVLATAGLEAQLLPIVNRAWPYILNRLSDKEPYVVLEGMRVLEALANECGDFVAGRVRDEGWPLIGRLLRRQIDADRKASLVLRHKPQSSAANPLHGSASSPFSTTHGLYASALATLTGVVAGVPVTPDIRWQILLLGRPFLDKAVHERLRRQARQLMLALGRIDPDAVWAGLTATLVPDDRASDEGVERMGWLREVGWDIKAEAEIVLGGLTTD